MILAIINAGVRNGIFKPMFGDLVAHQISTVIFILIIFVVTYLIFRFNSLKFSDSETLLIGVIWFVSTFFLNLLRVIMLLEIRGKNYLLIVTC